MFSLNGRQQQAEGGANARLEEMRPLHTKNEKKETKSKTKKIELFFLSTDNSESRGRVGYVYYVWTLLC